MLDIRIKKNIWENIDFFESSIVDIVDFSYKDKDKYPFLSSIDYYWVTFFSSQQVNDRIIPELEEINKVFKTIVDMPKLLLYLSEVSQHRFLEVIWD